MDDILAIEIALGVSAAESLVSDKAARAEGILPGWLAVIATGFATYFLLKLLFM